MPHLLYTFLCQWTFRGYHILAIVNSATMNKRVHGFFRFMIFSGYMPKSRIDGSCDCSICSVLRKCHNVLHSDCINLHSHQQCKRAPYSPHSLQHLLFVDHELISHGSFDAPHPCVIWELISHWPKSTA